MSSPHALSDVLDELRTRGLMGRCRLVRVGDTEIQLEPETLALPVLPPSMLAPAEDAIARTPEEQRAADKAAFEAIQFASAEGDDPAEGDEG